MIARSHRFHGLGSLRFVFKKGETVRAPHCSLRYTTNNRRSTFRLAVVVSRKVHKNAVVRNRIRRRVYEAFRTNEKNVTKPLDLVISVYDDQFADMPSEKLQKIILELLKKANITN